MKELFRALLSATVLAFAIPLTTKADDAPCNGSLVGIFDGNVVVPNGARCELLPGSVVVGNVEVEPGGILLASGTRIGGNVEAYGAVQIQILDQTIVLGNVAISNSVGGAGDYIQNSEIGGNLSRAESATAGDFSYNAIIGNLEYRENLGGPHVLVGNVVGGNLSIEGNAPAPVVSGNSVVGSAEYADAYTEMYEEVKDVYVDVYEEAVDLYADVYEDIYEDLADEYEDMYDE
jgi:hypothetical protein